MNWIELIARGVRRWVRGVMMSKIPSPASLIEGAEGGCLPVSEKRRQAAAVQEAGARQHGFQDSRFKFSAGNGRRLAAICVPTSAFAPKLPPSPGFGATTRRDKQVIDISSKMEKSRVRLRTEASARQVASNLISRRLRRKRGDFLKVSGKRSAVSSGGMGKDGSNRAGTEGHRGFGNVRGDTVPGTDRMRVLFFVPLCAALCRFAKRAGTNWSDRDGRAPQLQPASAKQRPQRFGLPSRTAKSGNQMTELGLARSGTGVRVTAGWWFGFELRPQWPL